MGRNMRTIFFLFILALLTPLALAEYNKVGSAELYTPANSFMDDTASKIAMIIPAILILVCFVTALIDFGAVGVTLSSMGVMVILNIFGIIAISVYSLTTYL